MKSKRIHSVVAKRLILILASGGLLGLSCPSGTGKFLAPIVQPVLADSFSQIANQITDGILGQ